MNTCLLETWLDLYDGFFFDLDGTLVDTMPLNFSAYHAAFKAFSLNLSEELFYEAVGGPASQMISSVLDRLGKSALKPGLISAIHNRKKFIFQNLLETTELRCLPAAEILCKTKTAKKKVAIVTSANARGARLILKRIGMLDLSDVIITGESCHNGKPSPEPYLHAIKRLGVPSESGLAFEDHPLGLASARSAGLAVIDVRKL